MTDGGRRTTISRRWRPAAMAGLIALAVLGLDLAVQQLAEQHLPGNPIDLGPLRLELAHNTGVAFSVGTGLPAWVVLAVTTAIIAGLAVATLLGRLRPPAAAGLILGGAVANLIDRAADSTVTDYLALGWWPTFNLADTAITLGAITLLWTALRHPQPAGGTSTDQNTDIRRSQR